MENFTIPVQVRWSDLDPNFHLRHSVYYDWGAMCRVNFLNKMGLSWKRMMELHIGPIIFREECIFRKEIRLDDVVTIDLKLIKAKKDFSRFTVQHEIKKEPGITSAILTVDIAWINGLTRKLAVLPEEEIKKLTSGPVTENFQWSE
jgi:acyl-CoA thioester hydrolase